MDRWSIEQLTRMEKGETLVPENFSKINLALVIKPLVSLRKYTPVKTSLTQ